MKSKRKQASKGKQVPRSQGVIFPIAKINSMLKSGRYSSRIGASAGVFLAGALEYITAEILELSGDHCHENKMQTIQPRHINLSIRSDEELSKLISLTTISSGGMTQNISQYLVPKPKLSSVRQQS